ncbi:ciliogenesis-associated TTC17-interacting protein isoform X15 [Leucoraja erinacea]|uniref:ciliogenesis-associated TTC17-interacting protein isoform X13 n=1 Tax=Leucoraja erinaceus TaxID=7782 RepID=UPI0024581662|nr:ciliogenesis-associated TTC17-interacting protein isoform X13 [Leucoraja erinacea]XP_055487094.1 ciliogenesis-associated TTC17-interacting protein isoform X15 [Leucoraja erinacea]
MSSSPGPHDPPLDQGEELSLSEGKSQSGELSPFKGSSQEETTPPEEKPVKTATFSLQPSQSDEAVTGESTPAGGKTPIEKTPSRETSPTEEESTPPDATGWATSPREPVSFGTTRFADEETIPTDATSPTEPVTSRTTKFADEVKEEATPADATGRETSPREPVSFRGTTFADEVTTSTDATGRAASPREPVSSRETKFADEVTTPTDATGRAASPREPVSFRETKFADELETPRDAAERSTTPMPTSLQATTPPGKAAGTSPMEFGDVAPGQPASLTAEKEQKPPDQPAETTPPPPPPPPPPSLPKASPEAIDFLASITTDELSLTHFTDSLVTISDTGKELGEFTISFHPIICEGLPGIKVTANSHGSIDNIPCGTSISARISGALATAELQHQEYIKLKEHSLTKKTDMKKTLDGYFMTREVTVGESVKSETMNFSLGDLKGFVSEASNLVLLRIMAQRNHVPDNMVFLAFDSEMQLSTSTYLNLGPKMLTVGKSEVEVRSIQRTIHSDVNSPMSWQCSFLPDGHLTSRVQVGSPITMKLQQLPHIRETDVIDPKPVFEKKPLDWEEDMQLYFKFIDRTEELKAEYNSYIRHHPELKCIMADFLEFLLLRKPQDVVTFAAEYFASFSAFQAEQSPFLSSNRKSPFRET